MRENKLKTLWANGGAAMNCWLSMDSSLAAEAMAYCDWDSITVDMQHSLIDWRSALTMLQAASQKDAPTLMRVPWLDPAWIMRALDAGAYGVICPMVNNRADCEKFVGACRYAPTGYRSWGPVRGMTYGGPDYFKHANDTILTFAMIETREALDNLDEILSTPGLDGIYIGPNDLSISLGYSPAYYPDEPEVLEAFKRILDTALKNDLIPGVHCGSAEMAGEMVKMGFKFCTIQSASKLMVDAANNALTTARAVAQSN